jgi:hypothetical protein
MKIKYNTDPAGNIKVITKDRKVSCECCGCCMYPASVYRTLYQFEDLPDQIKLTYTNLNEGGFFQYTLTKILNESISYIGGPDNEVVINHNDISWSGADGGGATGGGGECLIYNYKQEAELFTYEEIVEDFFADTYSISGPISGTVTRSSDFREFSEEIITIKYNCGRWIGSGLRLSFNSTKCKWTVNGNEKAGFQNTPVGSYAGGFSVS